MPIYEYRCGSCGHQLEALQKISDEHLTDCPACGESALRRLVSAPSFRLKGGGWYETDFKKDQDRKRNLADTGDGKPASAGDSAAKGDGGKTDGAKSDGGKSDGAKADAGKDAGKKDAGNKDKPPKSGSSEAVA
ncbi:MAG: zinc ribbon domain-containing protein [Gammaproteobacteria bacterium]|nr:zinc ribbon domain-containing protein [Gammaproteobacteria bacterium]